jgi:hypothetical protein
MNSEKGNVMTLTRLALRPATLLRLEGAAVAVASILLYRHTGGNWLLFALLLLAPDLAAFGYLAGTSAGAATYNLVHTYALPAAVLAGGLLGSNSLAISLAIIWFTHIGLDRLLGFGLKYPTAFKDTHLDRV